MLGPHSVVVLSRVQKDKLYQFATKEEFFDGAFFRQHYYYRMDSNKLKRFNGTGNVKEFITKV